MSLVVTPPKVRHGVKWHAKRLDHPSAGHLFDARQDKDVARIALRLDVTRESLLAAIEEARREREAEWAKEDAEAAAKAAPPPEVAAEPELVATGPPLRVRAWLERGGAPEESYPTLEDAISTSKCDLFAWEGTEQLVALDVDLLHPGRPFSERELLRLVDEVPAPLPAIGWITRSGGVRLIFKAAPGFTARARACLYLLLTDLALDDRVKRIEMLPRTRRPPATSRLVLSTRACGVVDLPGRIKRSGGEASVTEEEIQKWLDQRGLHYGRHPHGVCPIAPSEKEARDPVIVGAEGVYCHYCAGNRGPARAFRSWASLIGGHGEEGNDAIAAMGINFVHSTHARLVLLATYPTVHEEILRHAYDALLRTLHPTEVERIGGVFNPHLAVVRGPGQWLRADDFLPHDSIGPGTFGSLPWVAGSPVRRDLAAGSGKLAGYLEVLPVTHLVVSPEWRFPYVLVPRKIHSAPLEGDPLEWPACEELLTTVLAGTTSAWVKVVLGIVVSALRAQRGAPMPPFSILQALTGSGKGAAVALAEGILGAPVAPINLAGQNAQEVATSIGMGLESGAMLLFGDEAGKVKDWWIKSSALLAICDTHSWRKLHVGMVKSPVRAAIVLAASTLPRGLSTMPEFHRRVTVFGLPRVPVVLSSLWEQRVDEILGVVSLTQLRNSSIGAKLAEGFLAKARSYVPDEPLPSWPTQAKDFGGQALQDYSEDSFYLRLTVEQLYLLWTGESDRSLTDSRSRWSGWLRCWKVGVSEGDVRDTAAEALERWISDEDPNDMKMAKLHQLETVDVAAILGLGPGVDVRFAARAHGRRVHVRFESPLAKDADRRDPRYFPRIEGAP